ncbi:glycerol-3-phosphate transporter family protein [Tripterygium wilfordii]|uniref:Glycerol-3-phosphate transporter family protein n=1 Tax=Tripterygium wilfordii TaxID=458696 RepID=A0A7J7D6X2_TRIWF|nr:putative glycerol-3-phosphate transporter 5 [Tripterygium wilfordii]KAF5742043.1 glycerol-3-phosphate transporter family protein [Tripterygium wilfordii]
MQSKTATVAPALTLFPTLRPPHRNLIFHQVAVLILTFFAYASFHASRKPPSIVKSVLGPKIQSNSSEIVTDSVSVGSNSTSIDTGWAPFNGPGGTQRLGELDLAFLSSYSIGMFFAGHVGDRIDLRLFLVFGMMGSGAFTIIFGLGYWFNVHLLWFFVFVQIVCGLFQSIGWPCVVAVVGNWFGKGKRGLIMGVWTSHTSVGNIIGSVVASSVLEFGWGWSFVMPGLLVIMVGVLVFLFLVVSPDDIGYENLEKEIEMNVEVDGMGNLLKGVSEEAGLLGAENSDSAELVESKEPDSLVAIGFLEAWMLPGVAPFAFCLFFSKLVAYTFLYWLPFYIRHTAVAGVHLSHKTAGILSTIFDIGGVFGGIIAGYVSDVIEARGLTSVVFLLLSIPALILYRIYGSLSMITNIGLMFLSGLLVNGPYSLITTAVAADLGTQDLIKGNSRALATVTAIIDGTGSIGAAVGPLLAGYISTRGWNSVFFMLIVSISFASLFLIRIARTEIKGKLNGWS